MARRKRTLEERALDYNRIREIFAPGSQVYIVNFVTVNIKSAIKQPYNMLAKKKYRTDAIIMKGVVVEKQYTYRLIDQVMTTNMYAYSNMIVDVDGQELLCKACNIHQSHDDAMAYISAYSKERNNLPVTIKDYTL